MSAKANTFYLPETMATWPWPRTINRHYEEVKAASDAWFQSFQPFTAESQRAFDACDFGRLASLAYPWASKEHLRTGCDLMNLFFVIDKYTDVEDATACRQMVDIIIDALNNPEKPRPEGEVVLGEITRQFWALAIKTASPNSQQHFLATFTAYLESVISEAADRDSNTIRTIESYMINRRQNAGAHPSFVPIELGLNLPDEVFHHPVIVELAACIADIIVIDNDLNSYNREQATGHEHHNVLTVVMHQLNCSIEHVIRWAVDYHHEMQRKFIHRLKDVPSWGPEVDKQVDEYTRGLANWARAINCWSFESRRYFGDKGLEIQKTRCVPLLPKRVPDKDLRRQEVAVPVVQLVA